ncbi:hypothetical protein BBI01_00015 [Chryseobacterium artocarpi]|uniref:Response regulatory domain-containing protein n=1 Tax=Chryseobacterium artocarpi TaxID=1414727 RepID=A0A1B8ZZB4_9FLAO|nr:MULTISPECIES: hypothetical protein [Weeksellaceae]KGT08773.1 hypothetical protein NV63_13200 [Elizabethkingia anophelis]MCL1675499.1 hypothetical protein [Elizabethkingia meningoseptica]MCL1687085.1 hypothetical protein [Elizabethkingia meningoseptica]MDV3568014.1 hypothetical protein [Elizabethkingia anophelis]MDV3752475.1 hypothetical protein [Elizabethkingia anophelis]
MKKNNILVIGRDPKTLQGVVEMLKENGYDAQGESIDEQALEIFNKYHFDGVLLGGGVGPQSREILIPAFIKKNPQIKIASGHPWQALDALSKIFSYRQKR